VLWANIRASEACVAVSTFKNGALSADPPLERAQKALDTGKDGGVDTAAEAKTALAAVQSSLASAQADFAVWNSFALYAAIAIALYLRRRPGRGDAAVRADLRSIIKQLGFDPLWFGVHCLVNMQMSFLSPPFGYALFYLRGAAPD
jgi:hypothetical protein